MDFLKFFKKHYEKVLLSVVLAVLAGATIYLLSRVMEERRQLDAVKAMDPRLGSRPLPPLDLSTNEALLSRLRRPGDLQLESDHNIFNPVTWKRQQDGNLVKMVSGNELGAGALTITKLSPLMLRVSYEGPVARGNQTSYRFRVTQEAHRKASERGAKPYELTGVGQKNTAFVLREIRPSAEDPQEFVLEMLDPKKEVVVSAAAPYEGVAGYTADLRYEPEKLPFLNKRVGDRLVFAGDTNQIVAIEADSLTVEAMSNRKRTTVSRNPESTATEQR